MSLRVACCAVIVLSLASLPGAAQDVQELPAPPARVPQASARTTARTAAPLSSLELAKAYRSAQRLHHYRYMAYPEHVRQLDAAIALSRAETAVLADRLRHYQQFASFGSDSSAYTAAQNTRLALLVADEQLRQLRRERDLLSRQRRSTILSLQIEHLERLEQLRRE